MYYMYLYLFCFVSNGADVSLMMITVKVCKVCKGQVPVELYCLFVLYLSVMIKVTDTIQENKETTVHTQTVIFLNASDLR